MGKVKRNRQKYHSSTIKNKNSKQEEDPDYFKLPSNSIQLQTDSKAMVLDTNIFSSINIDKSALTQRLPDLDARSVITSKTLKGLSMKKKDKLKLRREYFMQKMNAIEVERKKDKERKKRKRTPVVGDMSVIEEALPTLDLLMKTSSKDRIPNVKKKRCVEKAKNRRKKGLSNIKGFRQVLKHPAFKKNPGATINEHLHNKLKLEESEDT